MVEQAFIDFNEAHEVRIEQNEWCERCRKYMERRNIRECEDCGDTICIDCCFWEENVEYCPSCYEDRDLLW